MVPGSVGRPECIGEFFSSSAMLKNLPNELKLILLAGVPVLGALILSYLVAVDAQRRLDSAKALGSIEDLAQLASTISKTVDALQKERTASAFALGRRASVREATTHERERVEVQVKALGAFFESRDTSALPPRLAEGIARAQQKLSKRVEMRKKLDEESVQKEDAVVESPEEALDAELAAALGEDAELAAALGEENTDGGAKLEDAVSLYDAVNADLIAATAALTSLSDDGVMLRNISGLVSVMELKERASRERGLLAYVFSESAYPPGGYKILVNLVTEQEVFDKVFRQTTSADLVTLYDSGLEGSEMDRAGEMRKIALDTMDDNFGIKAQEWVDVQGKKLNIFRDLSVTLNDRVKEAALARLREAKGAVSTSFAVSGGVVLFSLILAVIISLGISRSVGVLASAASTVKDKQDFSVRAEKMSEDELGSLTDAFNHMLDGIQARDKELADHRANLEATVEKRTAELAKRNEAMRVVLDNVEQGLATINIDGTLEPERSAAFDSWFHDEGIKKDAQFSDILAANDNNLQLMLELGWEGFTDGFLPLDVAADQIPRKLVRGEQHFDLTYKPMGSEGDFHGALLMVSDVTEEIARNKKEAEQREMIAVFEAVMKDRGGFIEFFNDAERMVMDIVQDRIADEAVLKRVVHTGKCQGSCRLKRHAA